MHSRNVRRGLVILAGSVAVVVTTMPAPEAQGPYFPPKGQWERRAPAQVGMDAAKLDAALKFAASRETNWPKNFATQEEIFGTMLGSIPSYRPATAALVIRNGYIVGEMGPTEAVATTYSVAKSMLATVAGVAVRDGRIRNLDEPVGALIKDGGYTSAQNAKVTWRQHLHQETEWEGEMWGKKHDFVGREAFGSGERKPRALQAPGTFYEYNDVRINRFALSLLRLFNKSVPDVFRDEVANVIGMSDAWQWVPYTNSYVEIDGQRMPSVSGGTRWGGGVWISAYDLARFGYLWLRGGQWAGKTIVPPAYVKEALTPSAHGPDYGFLWWLHTQGRAEGIPRNAYEARGAGSNTIFVSPDHDLVVVWRWHGQGSADYTFDTLTLFGRTNGSRRRSANASVSTGRFYSGTRTEFRAGAVWTVSPRFSVQPAYTRNVVSLPVDRGRFTTNIVELPIKSALNRELFGDALVQYDDVSKRLQANIRVNWIHTPGSNLYLVLDTGVNMGDLPDPRVTRWERRTGVIKLTYLIAL